MTITEQVSGNSLVHDFLQGYDTLGEAHDPATKNRVTEDEVAQACDGLVFPPSTGIGEGNNDVHVDQRISLTGSFDDHIETPNDSKDSSYNNLLSTQSDNTQDNNLQMNEFSDVVPTTIDMRKLHDICSETREKLKNLCNFLDNAVGVINEIDSSHISDRNVKSSPVIENEPASFVKAMEELKNFHCFHDKTSFLDLGSGKGMPCFILAIIFGVPSFGIEIQENMDYQSLKKMEKVHEFAIQNKVPFDSLKVQHCHFVNHDIMKLHSFSDYTFIFMGSLS